MVINPPDVIPTYATASVQSGSERENAQIVENRMSKLSRDRTAKLARSAGVAVGAL
jgi:hypothetical protein